MTETIYMWEIFVPTSDRNGALIPTAYHQRWDEQVSKIVGGVTLTNAVKGRWVSNTSDAIVKEKIIPVRVAATEKQIDEILDITVEFYNQEAVLCYLVSDRVILRRRE